MQRVQSYVDFGYPRQARSHISQIAQSKQSRSKNKESEKEKEKKEKNEATKKRACPVREKDDPPEKNAGPPPLDLSFWSFLTFLHHGIEKVERHLLWKFHKKIQRKSWSNVLPKLLACIGFLYKVVHKNGRLRKFNRAREIEFNFFTVWTIIMKLGTLVHHVHGYKILPQIF